jgi:phosphoribosylformylglycinamidine synthase
MEKIMHLYKDVGEKVIKGKLLGVEECYNIKTLGPLTDWELSIIRWLLANTYEQNKLSAWTQLVNSSPQNNNHEIVEIGPRLSATTPWAANALSIIKACGITKVERIERSKRYVLKLTAPEKREELISSLHDRMREMVYLESLSTFETGQKPEPVYEVPIIEQGIDALREINSRLGLGMDEWDLNHNFILFAENADNIGRNPTNVECFDLGQSNSEHSRHWVFNGRIIIDGQEMPQTFMELIKAPYKANPGNSVIAFKDNSSAIKGYEITTIVPELPGQVSRFKKQNLTYHIIFTAETHNFPTGVCPFPGAETGTGGRIRDVHATGKGSLVIAGTAAYCVGNLRIPGYDLPWEDSTFEYPGNLATPLQIEIEASNGASDYGNKFGEPVIQGFTRSFGLRLPDGERREWVKPIMFTGGIGQIDSRHTEKGEPKKGMLVVKVGGPAYRIGIGGGAASSMIQGENIAELDFNAVQRGDAQMEQKVNRVIRACVEMGDNNFIVSIHDQGAGGNCNVVKEIIYPAGAKIKVRDIQLGDNTLSVLEIWGAEYQEQDALLICPERMKEFMMICARENVPCAIIGEISGDGYIVLHDETDNSTPVNLDLKKIMGEAMPQKVFTDITIEPVLKPLALPEELTLPEALERVLRLLSVGSKRLLINKVDRSVTGLIARQQCAGPLQLTLADAAVVAQSHFPNEQGFYTGAATAIGEQPIKGLIDPAAGARMSFGEALTNLIGVKISSLNDISSSVNWMWPAKLPGEMAKMYRAAEALSEVYLKVLGKIDGGKDSLSMAAKLNKKDGSIEVIKAPGQVVISLYATCPDITKVITPDIKNPADGNLLVFFDLSGGKQRLGGSALAHVYGQIGDESPDIDNPVAFKNSLLAIQEAIDAGLILSLHDRSDGGLIVTLLEMAFGGNCGFDLMYLSDINPVSFFFNEELGLVLEMGLQEYNQFVNILKKYDLQFCANFLGHTSREKKIKISYYDSKKATNIEVLNADMRELRQAWEETSYQLDCLQANPECVEAEKKNIFDRRGVFYKLAFNPEVFDYESEPFDFRPRVAILRDEGSNGDRDMSSAFYQAGFQVFDITMTDLLAGRAHLAYFRGLVFVGGFSRSDVFGSGKGWAGIIRSNSDLLKQFDDFYNRSDTFSLGVCNGCQLMALLGWVPWKGITDARRPVFIQNKSGRFESRWSTVKILPSPAIMFKNMADSILGVWVAHGEGRLYFPDPEIGEGVLKFNLDCLRYVDDIGNYAEEYPFNPNGSPSSITALCSPDGRHLAMMPHPERTFLKWQWGYMPEEMKKNLPASPWMQMFVNARNWCVPKLKNYNKKK